MQNSGLPNDCDILLLELQIGKDVCQRIIKVDHEIVISSLWNRKIIYIIWADSMKSHNPLLVLFCSAMEGT